MIKLLSSVTRSYSSAMFRMRNVSVKNTYVCTYFVRVRRLKLLMEKPQTGIPNKRTLLHEVNHIVSQLWYEMCECAVDCLEKQCNQKTFHRTYFNTHAITLRITIEKIPSYSVIHLLRHEQRIYSDRFCDSQRFVQYVFLDFEPSLITSPSSEVTHLCFQADEASSSVKNCTLKSNKFLEVFKDFDSKLIV